MFTIELKIHENSLISATMETSTKYSLKSFHTFMMFFSLSWKVSKKYANSMAGKLHILKFEILINHTEPFVNMYYTCIMLTLLIKLCVQPPVDSYSKIKIPDIICSEIKNAKARTFRT